MFQSDLNIDLSSYFCNYFTLQWEFTDHLCAAGEKWSWETQSPWQRHSCDSFQLSSRWDKATVVCALYCDNRPCWGAKGAALDPRPTHVAREEGVFLVPQQRRSEQTENGSIPLPPPGFTKQFKEKQNHVVFFHLFKSFTYLCWYWFCCNKSFCSCLHPTSTCLCVHWRGIYFPQDRQVNSPTEFARTQLSPIKLSNLIHNLTNSHPWTATCTMALFSQHLSM